MLKKEYRLKKRTAFTATYRTGKSFHKDGITVFCGKIKKEDIAELVNEETKNRTNGR